MVIIELIKDTKFAIISKLNNKIVRITSSLKVNTVNKKQIEIIINIPQA